MSRARASFPETNHTLQAMRLIAEEELRSHISGCVKCKGRVPQRPGQFGVMLLCEFGFELLNRVAQVQAFTLPAPAEKETNAGSSR